ncbi:diptericin A-like [Episyrphus balteatus]|uniref:diptericin A-like n=1 Tax=Episyrphus balteatus TaxID=286459 RepID=UPI00248647EA|nr:diptericin A-like [Episyrphus balteatus]
MNKSIIVSFFICLGLAVVLAYPAEELLAFENNRNEEFAAQNTFDLHREKRQFNMDGTSIAGSNRQGYDVNVNSRFPIWKSENGRSSFDGTAGFSQHVNGPYGNSKPDYRGGFTFTHRF